jgi:hypothetical protein
VFMQRAANEVKMSLIILVNLLCFTNVTKSHQVSSNIAPLSARRFQDLGNKSFQKVLRVCLTLAFVIYWKRYDYECRLC